MIERVDGYKVGTGFFPTLPEAQVEALKAILGYEASQSGIDVITTLVSKAPQAAAILSPPKELRMRATRRDKGTKHGPRTRRTSPATAPSQPPTQAAA